MKVRMIIMRIVLGLIIIRVIGVILASATMSTSIFAPKKLDDKFVEYYDESSRVSYGYNSTYVMSTGNLEIMEEIENYSAEIYERIKIARDNVLEGDENAQYYVFRNSNNKVDHRGNEMAYIHYGDEYKDVNLYEITDRQYEADIIKQGEIIESKTRKYNVVSSSSEKYVTYGDNKYLYIRLVPNEPGNPFTIEQYYLQLKNGDTVMFSVSWDRQSFAGVHKYFDQILESVKVN